MDHSTSRPIPTGVRSVDELVVQARSSAAYEERTRCSRMVSEFAMLHAEALGWEMMSELASLVARVAGEE